MFEGPAPRVFTIESGVPFVDILAARLLDEAGDDPLALAEMRVLLPTRRACRSLGEAFLRHRDGQVSLLPRLMPLGDLDEDELAISEAGDHQGEGAGDLPPTMPGLRRQLLLCKAIMAMPAHDLQPPQAVSLALELGRLIDRLATEDSDPAKFHTLVADEYAEHWQEVLRFLRILTDHWPAVLDDEGAQDPAARRNAILGHQAAQWTKAPPTMPVIAAGSTGSIPATANLLSVIAGLPAGAVVLPGLDRDMPDDAWSALGPTHPQFGLKQLLARLGVERADVADFAPPTDAGGPGRRRGIVMSAALQPAAAGVPAVPDGETLDAALRGLTRIDCPGPSEEAAAVALVMRRTLETPGKTCALVTPDRGLARRVAAALARWGLEVDDSAGRALATTPPGAFLRLVADAARERLSPVPLLALLKHPLAAGGLAAADFRGLVRAFEIAALRGPRPGGGYKGLQAVLGDDKKHARLRPLLKTVTDAMSPLIDEMARERVDYARLLKAHIAAAEALAGDSETPGAARLWAGEAGEAAANFIAELADALPTMQSLPGAAYAGFFERLMDGRAVRSRFGAHPRLFIWGLLEARLQHADTVVLGGLNEGSWPPAPETNPWMSRPMMADMGLESPERRIGLTAHDFQQALAAPEVILTRADRVAGAPTVPSRWVLRLDNLLARAGTKMPAPEPWLGWVQALDAADRAVSARPRPCPPVAARPTRLSVTQVETLIRDPYAIYARHILRLDPLDPIDADPGAMDRGNIIHEALKNFIDRFPGHLPDDAERHLLEFGRKAFADQLARPGVRAFWWPRFERIAAWFVQWQRERLAAGWEVRFAEDYGGFTIDAVEGGFEIFAKPDRIDYRPEVGLSIIDYKTGIAPTKPQVESGLSPQLPLEALIAAAGRFDGVPEAEVAELMYVRLSGGRTPGETRRIDVNVAALMDKTREGVGRLVVAFADENTPYLSRPRPQYESQYGTYDHLARVGEWSRGGDEE